MNRINITEVLSVEEGQASLLQLFNTAIEVENWVEKLYKEATVQYDTDKASRGALWNFTDGLDTKLEGLKDLIDSQQAFLDMHPDKVRQRGSADTVAGPSTSSGTQIGSQQRGSAAGPEVINESQAQANLSGQPEPVIYQGQDVVPSKTLFLPGQRTPTEEDWKKVEAVEHSCEELPVLGLCGGCEERNTGLWCNVKDGSPCSNCVGLRKLLAERRMRKGKGAQGGGEAGGSEKRKAGQSPPKDQPPGKSSSRKA